MEPTARLHALPHADGSASYQYQNYEVLATVNGPIEVQRRDELPEEAFVEVNVRPASGGGSPRDRLLESLIQRTLKSLVDLRAHPRSLIQITLQVVRTPDDIASVTPPHQSDSVLPVLPALVNAGLLALLSGNVPLFSTCAAVSVDRDGARHVFGYASGGDLLLAESEGNFDLKAWAKAEKQAKSACESLERWMRGVVEEDLRVKMQWREK